MIKDFIVNLDVSSPPGFTGNYAISVGRAFEAHIFAVAFAYEAVLPESFFGHVAVEFIEAERGRCETAAKNAIAQFNEAARDSRLSTESRLLSAGIGQAAEIFGRLARRFDLAVVAQAEPGKLPDRELINDTRAVRFRSTGAHRALYSTRGP